MVDASSPKVGQPPRERTVNSRHSSERDHRWPHASSLKLNKGSVGSLPRKQIKFSDDKLAAKKLEIPMQEGQDDALDQGTASPPPLNGPSKVSFDGPQSFIER